MDASSEESFKDSTKEMYNALEGEKKAKFQKSLALLLMSGLDIKAIFTGSSSQEDIQAKAMSSINGMTAEQVIAKADQVIKERKEKRRQREEERLVAEKKAAEKAREQALKEIAELQVEKKAAEAAKAELAKFKILKSRFYKRKEFGGTQPIIELSVKNGTECPVACIYCDAVLASPGRSVPWLKEKFNYDISGGLEPGEKANWSLAPNMFSDWGKINAPKDAILTVTVYRLDGAGEKQLFSSEFSEWKEERLQRLLEKYK